MNQDYTTGTIYDSRYLDNIDRTQEDNKNILLKRAFCTTNYKIPINLQYYNRDINDISEFTIFIPVHNIDGKRLPEFDRNSIEEIKEAEGLILAGDLINKITEFEKDIEEYEQKGDDVSEDETLDINQKKEKLKLYNYMKSRLTFEIVMEKHINHSLRVNMILI